MSGHVPAGEGVDTRLTILTKPFTGPVLDLKVVGQTNESQINVTVSWKLPANTSLDSIKVSWEIIFDYCNFGSVRKDLLSLPIMRLSFRYF